MARCCVRLSVVCNVRTVAKQNVLPKNCLKKQTGLPDRYPVVPIGTPYEPHDDDDDDDEDDVMAVTCVNLQVLYDCVIV